ncbi:hypothetical protein Mgra_00008487 [Meloidogyne graminicola]|uniref:Uncharacterized protein n=1 Tax=Meloidogyne graminicola TaxID=189291 RepID=A0A8S9ZFL8_9BILA|nr:hypothetical protein Mgra_00008487 [Meloidogyne graminicola]
MSYISFIVVFISNVLISLVEFEAKIQFNFASNSTKEIKTFDMKTTIKEIYDILSKSFRASKDKRTSKGFHLRMGKKDLTEFGKTLHLINSEINF